MKTLKQISFPVLLILMSFTINSCGGGGGGDSRATVTNPVTTTVNDDDGSAPEQVTLYAPLGRTSSSLRLTGEPSETADFQGFQYFRDTDAGSLGHSGVFVPRVANMMLSILTVDEIQTMMDLAENQVATIEQFAYDRYPLIKAFHRNMDGDIPDGTTGLSKQAVIDYVGDLYRIDGQLSFERAQVLDGIIRNLTDEQRTTLNEYAALNGSLEWPELENQLSAKGFSGLEQGVGGGMELVCGDYRFCRDSCNAAYGE